MEKKQDIEIVSKTAALWTKVQEARTRSIAELEDSLIIEREVLKVAERIIAEEKRTFK